MLVSSTLISDLSLPVVVFYYKKGMNKNNNKKQQQQHSDVSVTHRETYPLSGFILKILLRVLCK